MLNIVKLYDYEYQILYRYYQKYDVSTPWCLSSRWSQGMTSTVLMRSRLGVSIFRYPKWMAYNGQSYEHFS